MSVTKLLKAGKGGNRKRAKNRPLATSSPNEPALLVVDYNAVAPLPPLGAGQINLVDRALAVSDADWMRRGFALPVVGKVDAANRGVMSVSKSAFECLLWTGNVP